MIFIDNFNRGAEVMLQGNLGLKDIRITCSKFHFDSRILWAL